MCQCKYASLSKAVNLKMSFHYIPAVTFSRFFSSYMLATHVNPSERQDNEIAQEIQEELVRQAERQRQQEEKDAVGSGPEGSAAGFYPSVVSSLPVLGGSFFSNHCAFVSTFILFYLFF